MVKIGAPTKMVCAYILVRETKTEVVKELELTCALATAVVKSGAGALAQP